MTGVPANGVTIEYETFGPSAAPAILLIMGLGMQLVAWPDSLCEGLARRELGGEVALQRHIPRQPGSVQQPGTAYQGARYVAQQRGGLDTHPVTAIQEQGVEPSVGLAESAPDGCPNVGRCQWVATRSQDNPGPRSALGERALEQGHRGAVPHDNEAEVPAFGPSPSPSHEIRESVGECGAGHRRSQRATLTFGEAVAPTAGLRQHDVGSALGAALQFVKVTPRGDGEIGLIA